MNGNNMNKIRNNVKVLSFKIK